MKVKQIPVVNSGSCFEGMKNYPAQNKNIFSTIMKKSAEVLFDCYKKRKPDAH